MNVNKVNSTRCIVNRCGCDTFTVNIDLFMDVNPPGNTYHRKMQEIKTTTYLKIDMFTSEKFVKCCIRVSNSKYY